MKKTFAGGQSRCSRDYLSALLAGSEGRAGPLVWTVLQTSVEQGTGAATAVLVARPPVADGATPRGP